MKRTLLSILTFCLASPLLHAQQTEASPNLEDLIPVKKGDIISINPENLQGKHSTWTSTALKAAGAAIASYKPVQNISTGKDQYSKSITNYYEPVGAGVFLGGTALPKSKAAPSQVFKCLYYNKEGQLVRITVIPISTRKIKSALSNIPLDTVALDGYVVVQRADKLGNFTTSNAIAQSLNITEGTPDNSIATLPEKVRNDNITVTKPEVASSPIELTMPTPAPIEETMSMPELQASKTNTSSANTPITSRIKVTSFLRQAPLVEKKTQNAEATVDKPLSKPFHPLEGIPFTPKGLPLSSILLTPLYRRGGFRGLEEEDPENPDDPDSRGGAHSGIVPFDDGDASQSSDGGDGDDDDDTSSSSDGDVTSPEDGGPETVVNPDGSTSIYYYMPSIVIDGNNYLSLYALANNSANAGLYTINAGGSGTQYYIWPNSTKKGHDPNWVAGAKSGTPIIKQQASSLTPGLAVSFGFTVTTSPSGANNINVTSIGVGVTGVTLGLANFQTLTTASNVDQSSQVVTVNIGGIETVSGQNLAVSITLTYNLSNGNYALTIAN